MKAPVAQNDLVEKTGQYLPAYKWDIYGKTETDHDFPEVT